MVSSAIASELSKQHHMAEVVVDIRWILGYLTLLLLTIYLCFYHNGDSAFLVEDVTTLKFNSLFQDKPFPISTRFHNIDETKHCDDCLNASLKLYTTSISTEASQLRDGIKKD